MRQPGKTSGKSKGGGKVSDPEEAILKSASGKKMHGKPKKAGSGRSC